MTDFDNRLETIFVEKLGVSRENLLSGKSFEDLELDSLSIIELAMLVKKEFGVELDDDEVTPEFTYEQTAELLRGKGIAA